MIKELLPKDSETFDLTIANIGQKCKLTWNYVYSIPYSLMKTVDKLAYRTNWNSEDWFEKDFKKVLENTLKILF